MRSAACLLTMAIVGVVLGPAGCRPARNDATARPDPHAVQPPEPTPASPRAQVSDDSTPLETDEPMPADPAPALEQLWTDYDIAQGEPERLKALDAQLQRYLDEHPGDPSALLLRANVYLEQDRIDEAFVAADRCIALSPHTADCWLVVAVISEARGSIEPALEGYRQYLELAPEARYAPDARKAIRRLEGEERPQ